MAVKFGTPPEPSPAFKPSEEKTPAPEKLKGAGKAGKKARKNAEAKD